MNIEKIAEMAKPILLETGEFPPCMFVELDFDGMLIVGLPQLYDFPPESNAADRAWYRFIAGRAFAQKFYKKKSNKRRRVTSVCEVVESWAGPPPKEGQPFIRPTFHPQRIEVLTLASLDAATMKQESIAYEMLRDGVGKLSDLVLAKDVNEPGVVVASPHIECFLAGIMTHSQDQGLASHTFRRIIENYARLVDTYMQRSR